MELIVAVMLFLVSGTHHAPPIQEGAFNQIIDSKRERLIAILTNNLVPCNGRFPTIIVMISMFLIGVNNKFHSFYQSFILIFLYFIFVLIKKNHKFEFLLLYNY